MANEDKKDFNAMLHRDTGMPKIQIVTDENTIKKYGGERMYFAPPLTYDEIMKKVPFGKSLRLALSGNIWQKRITPILRIRLQRGFLSQSPRGRAISAPGTKRRTGGH